MALKPAPVASSSRPAALPVPAHRGRRKLKTILGWASVGAGLAVASGAAVLYGLGSSRGDEAHLRYGAATSIDAFQQARADVEGAEKMIVAGHVLVGAAAAAVGFGLYHLLTRPASRAERPTVGLAPSAGGLSINVSARFW